MSRVPTDKIDYTSRDYEAFKNDMINFLKVNMPEYTDLSETDAGIVLLEALANGLDILSLYLDNVANDVFLPTTQDRKTAVVLARGLGYTPYNQVASEFRQIFVKEYEIDDETGERITEDSLYNEEVVIPKGTVITTEGSEDAEPVEFETITDLVIPANKWGDETDSNGNYIYFTTSKNMSSISLDEIGVSKGTAFQSMGLSYLNVLTDTIKLYVLNPDEITDEDAIVPTNAWLQVDSFSSYGPEDKVYRVTVDEFDNCTIEFGNGINGMIPVVDSKIVCDYAVGGGTQGNVDVGSITEIDSLPDGYDFEGTTFNPHLLKVGRDKESLDSIKINAPANFRSRGLLLSAEDYVDNLRIKFPNLFKHLWAVRSDNDNRNMEIYYVPTEEVAEDMTFKTTPDKEGIVLVIRLLEGYQTDIPDTYRDTDGVDKPVVGVVITEDLFPSTDSNSYKVKLPNTTDIRFVACMDNSLLGKVKVYSPRSSINLLYSCVDVITSYTTTGQSPDVVYAKSTAIYTSLGEYSNIEVPNNTIGACILDFSDAKIGYLHSNCEFICSGENVVCDRNVSDNRENIPKTWGIKFNTDTIASVPYSNSGEHSFGKQLKNSEEVLEYLTDNQLLGTTFSLLPSIAQMLSKDGDTNKFKCSVLLDSSLFSNDDEGIKKCRILIEEAVKSFFVVNNIGINDSVNKAELESSIVSQVNGLISIRINDSGDNTRYTFNPKYCRGEYYVAPDNYVIDSAEFI